MQQKKRNSAEEGLLQGTDALQAAQATRDSDKKKEDEREAYPRAAEAYQPIRGIQTKKSPER